MRRCALFAETAKICDSMRKVHSQPPKTKPQWCSHTAPPLTTDPTLQLMAKHRSGLLYPVKMPEQRCGHPEGQRVSVIPSHILPMNFPHPHQLWSSDTRSRNVSESYCSTHYHPPSPAVSKGHPSPTTTRSSGFLQFYVRFVGRGGANIPMLAQLRFIPWPAVLLAGGTGAGRPWW